MSLNLFNKRLKLLEVNLKQMFIEMFQTELN